MIWSDFEIEKAQIRKRLKTFVKNAWPIVEPGSEFTDGWHIGAICEHLEAVSRGDIRNLLINIPPRHGKSVIVSVMWLPWLWINRPETRWLFASYAQSLSIRDSVKCRRLIQSAWYQERFGHRFHLQDDQNEKIKFENDRMGYRLSTSVEGSATGEGGDFIICDDPHNVMDTYSKTIRESTVSWWNTAMSTRGNDPKTVRRVVIMQRIHKEDLSGKILEDGGYEHLCLPAEWRGKTYATSIGWQDPRKSKGELLWPERFGQPELAAIKKSLGSRGSAGQLDQDPQPEGGSIIKREWLKFYDALPEKFDQEIQSWDFSFKGNDDSDFVVGQAWGKSGANAYLFPWQVRGRMDFTATILAFKAFTAKPELKRCHAKYLEEKANGAAAMSVLGSNISGLIPVNPDKSKDARLHAVAPFFEAGNIWLPHPSICPWIHDYIEELVNFPGTANDDQVDATTQALTALLIDGVAEWGHNNAQSYGPSISEVPW